MRITPIELPDDPEGREIAEASFISSLRDFLTRDSWTLLDACLLVHLIRPIELELQQLDPDYLPNSVRKLMILAKADVGIELNVAPSYGGIENVKPNDFFDWLNRKDVRLPKLIKDYLRLADRGRALTKNELRKRRTLADRERWAEEYFQLLDKNPKLSKVDAARIIAKNQTGEKKRSPETIRKYLGKIKNTKVGR